ncbi:MAG: MFS transporter [Enterobacterales bacterium]|nr:MFS transporter [Enterobacterales bacterium]
MLASFLKNTWPLFLGLALLMLGNGLQGTLISWRATYEGFSATTTGWIMTGYYIGFLTGSLYTPKMVGDVGYIRVFAALASLASTAVLLQILFITPENWFFMRVLTGFCFAGTYVVVESWLNAAADNQSRGQMLSFYMLISYGGMAGGQWLINLAPPSGFSLFVLSSILLSLALVPILIRPVKVPDIDTQTKVGLIELHKIAPAGVYGLFVAAMAHGAMFGMGAVFAIEAGLKVSEIALFMSSFIALGAIAQWPLGWISDRFDRRLVLMGSGIAATIVCYALSRLDDNGTLFYTLFALLGAASLPMYSIAIAHTNDRLKPEQMAGASSTLVLVLGIGSILGPIISGFLLTTFKANGYLFYIGLAHLIIAIGMVYYMFKREAVADDDQIQYQVVPARFTGIAIEAIAQEAEESQESSD